MRHESLREGGRVFVKIVENYSKEELMPVIQGNILEKSVVYTNGWNGYGHYRVFYFYNGFARGRGHVNEIVNFWSFAKLRLARSSTVTRLISSCCT